MRDAFGGAFMIQLLIVFLIIYVSFTAVVLNYAKAFKVKNAVIEYLEKNEISDIINMPAVAEEEMRNYFNEEIVGNLGYVKKTSARCTNNPTTKCYNDIGIKIEQIVPGSGKSNKLGVYYRVTTYFGFDLSFFDRLYALSGRTKEYGNFESAWTIVGETRPIAFE